MTDEQLSKLAEAFLNDCSLEEAAAFAKVRFIDVTDKIATDPDWYGEMLALPNERYAKAKVNIGQKIMAGDLETSQWILERKRASEFSPRQKIDIQLPEVEGVKVIMPTVTETIESPKGKFTPLIFGSDLLPNDKTG